MKAIPEHPGAESARLSEPRRSSRRRVGAGRV